MRPDAADSQRLVVVAEIVSSRLEGSPADPDDPASIYQMKFRVVRGIGQDVEPFLFDASLKVLIHPPSRRYFFVLRRDRGHVEILYAAPIWERACASAEDLKALSLDSLAREADENGCFELPRNP